jgi:uncharacterized protein (TIGR02145 family)
LRKCLVQKQVYFERERRRSYLLLRLKVVGQRSRLKWISFFHTFAQNCLMKNLYLIVLTLFTGTLFSQAPALMPYQAVARDASGQALNGATINARFTIHDGTATGAAVWQEIQTVTTSALGLFTAQLGSSVSLTGLNWANGNKFMQVEIDLGQGYVDMGTQQMLSVPYALHSSESDNAHNAQNGISRVSMMGDTLYLSNGTFLILPGISAANIGGGELTTGTSVHRCGAANVHNPDLTYGTMTDQEGNVYKTIIIGTQEWMAENLNTSIYRNGDAISTNLGNPQWISTVSGAWAYYNDDVSNACPYGKLYNWASVLDSRNICPAGWHVPSDGEWSTVINVLDPIANGGVNSPNVVGIAMKSSGSLQGGNGYWNISGSNITGENSCGFSGLPGGYRGNDGNYYFLDYHGYWWSSTSYSNDSAWFRSLSHNLNNVDRSNIDVHVGFSVRCLRD